MSAQTVHPTITKFIEEIKKSQTLWALSIDDEWVVCDSVEFETTDVMPVFSDKAAAQALCHGDWATYTAEAIDIESFFDHWLTSLSEDGVLVGIDWDAEMNGPEVDPFELAQLMADQQV